MPTHEYDQRNILVGGFGVNACGRTACFCDGSCFRPPSSINRVKSHFDFSAFDNNKWAIKVIVQEKPYYISKMGKEGFEVAADISLAILFDSELEAWKSAAQTESPQFPRSKLQVVLVKTKSQNVVAVSEA